MQTTRLQRRRFHQLVVVGAAVVAAPLLVAQIKPEKAKITVAAGGKASFYHLPLTIADQLGYFKAEGIDLEISEFEGGTRTLQAVMGGAADVVSGAYEHTIQLQSKSQFFQSFVLQGRAPGIAMGVSTKTVPHFKSIADLRGKKIAVSAPGSSNNMLANLVLYRAGMKSEDVNFVVVGTPAAAVAAVRLRQVDAICDVDPTMTMLEQKGDIRLIVDTRTLKGTLEVFGGMMPAACLYAPQEFLQKNPGTAQAMANAVVHALKWLQTAGAGDIIKAVPESYLLGDRGLYLASFNKVREAFAVDGLMPDEGSNIALKALASVDSGFASGKINLNRTFTNEYARKAKDRFKA